MQNVSDSVNWILFTNPVSSGSIEFIKCLGQKLATIAPPKKEIVETKVVMMDLYRLVGCSRNFIRLAGVFGFGAVAFGVYGAHILHPKEGKGQEKYMFDTANRYHFLHTLALFAAPFTKHPQVTGSLFTMGIIMFSGSIYYQVIAEDDSLKKWRITPMGGTCLMLGWLSIIL